VSLWRRAAPAPTVNGASAEALAALLSPSPVMPTWQQGGTMLKISGLSWAIVFDRRSTLCASSFSTFLSLHLIFILGDKFATLATYLGQGIDI
jgi:hypothetical protein